MTLKDDIKLTRDVRTIRLGDGTEPGVWVKDLSGEYPEAWIPDWVPLHDLRKEREGGDIPDE